MKRSHVILTAAWLTTMLLNPIRTFRRARRARAGARYGFAPGKQHCDSRRSSAGVRPRG